MFVLFIRRRSWEISHRIKTALSHSGYFILSNTGDLISLIMTTSTQVGPVPGPNYSPCWFTGTPTWNRAIVNTISYTCAFPAATGQNVCCEKVYFPLDAVLALNRVPIPRFNSSIGCKQRTDNVFVTKRRPTKKKNKKKKEGKKGFNFLNPWIGQCNRWKIDHKQWAWDF